MMTDLGIFGAEEVAEDIAHDDQGTAAGTMGKSCSLLPQSLDSCGVYKFLKWAMLVRCRSKAYRLLAVKAAEASWHGAGQSSFPTL